MRSIAVMNQKGGVGKTTTAVNVASALARSGMRVLLVDLDPQAHATLHVGIEVSASDTTIYDILARGASAAHACRFVSAEDGKPRVGVPLSLIPSHIDLVAAEQELAMAVERETVLARSLAGLAEHYDVCVLDCPPSLGLVTINGLAAADEVVIPLQAHFLALQGLGKLLETVSAVRDALKPTLRVAGVVLCMHESATRLSHEVTEDVTRFLRDATEGDAWYGARVFETRIRRNVKLAEAPSFGRTIFEYAPESNGAADYRSLAREIAALTPHETMRQVRAMRSAEASDEPTNDATPSTVDRIIEPGSEPASAGTKTDDLRHPPADLVASPAGVEALGADQSDSNGPIQ